MPRSLTVLSIVDIADGYRCAGGRMSCDACPCS